MKKTIHRYTAFFRYISNTQIFKALYFVALIIAFYGGYALVSNVDNLKGAIFFPFTFNYFNLFFFCLFCILTIYTCSCFDQFNFYIIRMETKRKYIIELLSIVLFVNLIFLIMFLLLFIAFAILSQGITLEAVKYFYGITIGQYAMFYLLRYFAFLFLITAIVALFHVMFKSKFTIFIVGFILSGFFISTEFMEMEIVGFQWLPWKYFATIHYESFTKEIIFSLVYLINIVILTAMVLYSYLNLQKLRRSKYILINDISYLWNKRKHVLMSWLIVPVVALLFVNFKNYYSLIDLVNSSMGIGINSDSSMLSIIVYLFFLSLSIFLVLDLFLKDLKGNLALIFMRMKLSDWYVNKIMVLSLFVLFMKLVSYLIIFLLIIIFKGIYGYLNFNIVNILLTDFMSTVMIQLVSILVYIVFSFPARYKLIAIIGLLLFIGLYIYILPNIFDWILFMAIICILLFIISYSIFKNKNKSILQNVGGI